MKGIKKTLMAGLLACATFNAQAADNAQTADYPFSYGIKGGIGVSSPVGYGDAVKINDKNAQGGFFSGLTWSAGLFGSYAFTDYFGMGLEASYIRQGVNLTEEQAQSDTASAAGGKTNNGTDNSIKITTDGIDIGLSVDCFPLGRELETGILKTSLGFSFGKYLKSSCTDKETSVSMDDAKEKQLLGYSLNISGSAEYELSIGLLLGLKYIHGLTNRLNLEKEVGQTIFSSVKELKKLRAQQLMVSVGYNFASLLQG